MWYTHLGKHWFLLFTKGIQHNYGGYKISSIHIKWYESDVSEG